VGQALVARGRHDERQGQALAEQLKPHPGRSRTGRHPWQNRRLRERGPVAAERPLLAGAARRPVVQRRIEHGARRDLEPVEVDDVQRALRAAGGRFAVERIP
jgi:hypothetical protein